MREVLINLLKNLESWKNLKFDSLNKKKQEKTEISNTNH